MGICPEVAESNSHIQFLILQYISNWNFNTMLRLLVEKPGGKRSLGRPRRRWVDNIRMDLGEVGWSNVN
jgi:hypothetical protein